jgi:ribosomal-protein-alanine N-acetyltransferase
MTTPPAPLRFPPQAPTLQAGRWLLRPFSTADVPALRAYLTDPAVTSQTNYDIRSPRDVEMLVQYYTHAYSRHTDIRWAIVSNDDPSSLVGSCGLSSINERHRRAEIGYDLSPDHWGKGIATEAVTRVLKFAFEELGLNRIEATVMSGNEAAERVLTRLGFQREGVLRQYKVSRGVARDYTLFSLLRDEWLAAHAGTPEPEPATRGAS